MTTSASSVAAKAIGPMSAEAMKLDLLEEAMVMVTVIVIVVEDAVIAHAEM